MDPSFLGKGDIMDFYNELQKNDFKVYFQKNIPPNDGGISLGQIYFKLSGYEVSGFE